MAKNQFAPEEWYHCYSRGIDKRTVFQDKADYERFLSLLYLSNNTQKVHRSDIGPNTDIFSIPRSETIVQIGAFCLMPNHFHILLKSKFDGGISTFMQRLGTAYTMYFNIKNDRSGGLFAKPFRSRHIPDDRYLQRVIQYIHCNPAELYEPGWKEGKVKDKEKLLEALLEYPYASLGAFDRQDTHKEILDKSIFEIETQLPTKRMLEEAQLYYADYGKATP